MWKFRKRPDLLVYIIMHTVSALPEPSYVSDWETIKSQSDTQSRVVFYHNLNDWPIKVQAEVKVHSHGNDIIFPGMGVAMTDDDARIPYGEVITLYNDSMVMLMAPSQNNQATSGLVIYTGGYGWNGPDNLERSHSEAKVRVKVWLKNDFPTPDFTTSWETISVYDDLTYKEVQHDLHDYPSLIVVQVKASGVMFEAQGSTSRNEFTKSVRAGGVIYGFSNDCIRLWYPDSTLENLPGKQASLLETRDGWGLNGGFFKNKTGEFKIYAWKFPEDWIETTIMTKDEIEQKGYIMPLINIQHHYINVEVEALDGNNSDYRFYGVGSVVNDGDLGSYGGLVYSYCDRYVMFWLPSNHILGNIINIGGHWGRNSNHQSSDNVIVRINRFTHWDTPSYSYNTERQISVVRSKNSDIVPISDILLVTLSSYLQCANNCVSDFKCESFFYNHLTRYCVGYLFSNVNSNSTFESSTGMQHFVFENEGCCSYD